MKEGEAESRMTRCGHCRFWRYLDNGGPYGRCLMTSADKDGALTHEGEVRFTLAYTEVPEDYEGKQHSFLRTHYQFSCSVGEAR